MAYSIHFYLSVFWTIFDNEIERKKHPKQITKDCQKWVEIDANRQIISKANCQAVNSSKKRTNEFIFTTMRRVFVCFLEEIEVNKIHFEIN